jgi:FAD binding domain
VLAVNGVGDAFAFLAPFGDGWYRVIAWNRRRQLPDSAPVDLDEIRDVTRRALGTDYGMHDARWLSRFHSDERQVPNYRVGRVFLAGDAAHVHSPAGGQGMNVGMQDAANLGWKLAATVHGWAPEGLLDTYHGERHPVGQAVLRGSGAALRVALLGPAVLRGARDAIAGAAVRIRPLADRLAEAVSGIAIAYPPGSGAHRLAGRRAPDSRLAGGAGTPGRLYEALRAERFVLLCRAIDEVAVVRGWAGRVDVATPAAAEPTMVLVRPDGYIAWASDEADPSRRDADLRGALARWCGAPADPGVRDPARTVP